MQRRALSLFNPTIQDMMDVAKLANQASFDSAWNGEFFNQNRVSSNRVIENFRLIVEPFGQ